VYKEIAFKGADLDIYYVNAWVCVFQFLVGYPSPPAQRRRRIYSHFLSPFPSFLFFSFDRLASLLFLPITAIPGFGGLTFSEIPDNLGMCACALRVVSCRVVPGDTCVLMLKSHTHTHTYTTEDGARCLFTGHNSITTGKNVDDCEWAWTMTLGTLLAAATATSFQPSKKSFRRRMFTLMLSCVRVGYIIANIAYNIVILLMLKYGSAALLYVVRYA